jgi:hypothetical protein
VDAKFSVAVADSIPVHAQAWALPESSAISCAPPEQYQRTSISCLPQKASADLVLPLNITTIALVVLGLVLMSVIVLLATAIASAVILGTLDWAWVLQVAGLWLLILCGFVATLHRRGVKRHGKGKQRVTVEPVHVGGEGGPRACLDLDAPARRDDKVRDRVLALAPKVLTSTMRAVPTPHHAVNGLQGANVMVRGLLAPLSPRELLELLYLLQGRDFQPDRTNVS